MISSHRKQLNDLAWSPANSLTLTFASEVRRGNHTHTHPHPHPHPHPFTSVMNTNQRIYTDIM